MKGLEKQTCSRKLCRSTLSRGNTGEKVAAWNHCWVLVGLVVVAIPVAIIYLLVSHSGLKGQVALLRRETTMLKRSLEDMRVTAETAPQQAPTGAADTGGPAST